MALRRSWRQWPRNNRAWGSGFRGAPLAGKTILHCEIREKIGKGGMGEDFAAHDTELGRDVALKILPTESTCDPEHEMGFQRQARALASLQHPHEASVYGFEEADGVRFPVMELISGRAVASGTYFRRIEVDNDHDIRSLTLVR